MYSSLRSFVMYLGAGAVLVLMLYGMSSMFSPKISPKDIYKAENNIPLTPAAQYASQPRRPETARPSFRPAVSVPHKLQEQSLPRNGTAHIYRAGQTRQDEISARSGIGLAPFRIKADAGKHYYLKLLNAYDLSLIMTIFVRNHSIVDVMVPTGTYRVRYASGNTWYGETDLFGEDTTYGEFEDFFRFDTSGSDLMGLALDIRRGTSGSLAESSIGRDSF